MKIQITDSEYIRIFTMGYEFPDKTLGMVGMDYDANWLIMGFEGRVNGETWSSQSACMLTTDLNALIGWFETLCSHPMPPLSQAPTGFEPAFNIRYSGRSGKLAKLSIHLEPFLAPPSADKSSVFTIEVCLNRAELRKIQRELAEDALRFPVRNRDS
jgi:hypothetical protein